MKALFNKKIIADLPQAFQDRNGYTFSLVHPRQHPTGNSPHQQNNLLQHHPEAHCKFLPQLHNFFTPISFEYFRSLKILHHKIVSSLRQNFQVSPGERKT